MIQAYKYIVANWKRYDVVDRVEDFIALINILESHGECLDSLHDVCFNGRNMCCGIVFGEAPQSDREVAQAILGCHVFYRSWDDVLSWACDETRDDTDMNPGDLLEFETIVRTTDGYVRMIFC